MAEEGIIEQAPSARKKRKTSSRTKGVRKISAASEKLKALWADPEWRAKQLEKRAAGQAKRKDQGPNRTSGARLGIPDGMRKAEAQQEWAKAGESADKTMTELEKMGVFVDDDNASAREALREALTVLRAPGNQQVKLAAARLVLEYTKSKPASKSHVTVDTAEEWLKAVAQENDEREATEDAQASS